MFLWVDNEKISFNDDQEKAISESNLEKKAMAMVTKLVTKKKLLTVLLVARKRRRGISWTCELLQLSS